jgi:hypothetical protein
MTAARNNNGLMAGIVAMNLDLKLVRKQDRWWRRIANVMSLPGRLC